VTNERTGQVLGDAIGEARSLAARVRGLLGSPGLADGEGLWIEPCPSIHMFFMRFAIDAIFTDREQRVVRAVPNVRPWGLAVGGRGAHAVLELPTGVIERSQSRVGDRLILTPTASR